jgi:phosphosulfolactate synthase
MPEDPWSGLTVIDELRRRRTRAPRDAGLTMILDCGLGARETADVVEISGAHIDLWKLSFGTSVFMPMSVLAPKLALINARGIMTCPGGTLFEAAIVQQHPRDYMTRARALGFTAVEISDGTIPLPQLRRQHAIDCALELGLVPICEVGKKDPKEQPPPIQLAEQALQDLAWGAEHVIVEARESGLGIGVYDDNGNISLAAVDTIADTMGDRVDRLIWEAPLKAQQSELIKRFGPNVGLGNIDPHKVVALEALRAGLRFETLKPIAEVLQRGGRPAPELREPTEPGLRLHEGHGNR